MPNIEIHGFGAAMAVGLRGMIFDLFEDRPFVSDMVVTIHSTVVVDKDGNDQPFLRLANSDQSHTEEILERLKTLGIDIEILRLEGFIPKKGVETCGGG